jgi:RNA polymerase sigma-70 factor, ECF subfamily
LATEANRGYDVAGSSEVAEERRAHLPASQSWSVESKWIDKGMVRLHQRHLQPVFPGAAGVILQLLESSPRPTGYGQTVLPGLKMSHAPHAQVDDGERELIRRVCDGDQEAFYALVRPHERSIYFAAKSVLENDADAEEAAQEAVLKAFTHIREFRAESKFSTWLIQIAINEARMKLRKDHRGLYESLDEPRTDDEGDYWPSDCADWREIPSEALELKELRDALNKAMEGLTPKYRQVLICRDIQQLNIAETAQVLGISEVNVRQRLLRARLQMRDALAPGFDGAWTRGRTYEKVRPW